MDSQKHCVSCSDNERLSVRAAVKVAVQDVSVPKKGFYVLESCDVFPEQERESKASTLD